jgi:RNA polymerase sigma factor (sigma-70 family)
MKPAEPFEVIVAEHYEPLFRFAFSLTRAESDARDLTQQAFYVLLAKSHQLRDLSKVKGWLFTTLHRAYLSMRRRQAQFVDQEPQEVAERLPVDPSERGSPSDASRVRSALDQLDETHQVPVALYYFQDYSYREIAAVLEVPVGTVKSRISRGVEQLKQILISDNLRDAHHSAPTLPP